MINIGLKCKLYRGAAGSDASTLMKNVRDVQFGGTVAEADITTRGAKGWRINCATLKEGELTFQMLYDPEDADYIAVFNAYNLNTAMAFLVGDENGNGPAFDACITNFTIGQQLESGVMVDVTAKPTVTGGVSPVYPHWVGASSSSN